MRKAGPKVHGDVLNRTSSERYRIALSSFVTMLRLEELQLCVNIYFESLKI